MGSLEDNLPAPEFCGRNEFPTMRRKERFPPEADTQPDILRAKTLAARRSDLAPKKAPAAPRQDAPAGASNATAARGTSRRGSSAPPTREDDARPSGVHARRSARTGVGSATVDEVVADLSQDPRREQDEEETD